MKLKQSHLFYLLLAILLLCCFGVTVKEGLEDRSPPGAGGWGGVDPSRPKHRRRHHRRHKKRGRRHDDHSQHGDIAREVQRAGEREAEKGRHPYRPSFRPGLGGVPAQSLEGPTSPAGPPTNSPRDQPGIPSSQIPKGDEDLYVLKSSIVPPVCPKCPDIKVCPTKGKCPPCPPCGRCPEPAFKCKKVPDLKSTNTSYLPQPILTDFSQFSV